MDTKAIERHVRGILEAIGEDPDREGLRETPQRVARMYEEIFAGIALSNHEIAQMFGKTFAEDTNDDAQTAVVVKDISVFSYCEHHMALMYDMKVNVAYVPMDEFSDSARWHASVIWHPSACKFRSVLGKTLRRSLWRLPAHRM